MLTPPAWVMTGTVVFYAVIQVVAGISAAGDDPEFLYLTVVMLAFLLLCQIGITFYESYESASDESRSMLHILEAQRSLANAELAQARRAVEEAAARSCACGAGSGSGSR